jgi:hypothetical protein
MLTRRWARWVVVAFLLPLTGAVLLWATDPPDRITEGNSHRITKGMSRNEVVAILGREPDEERQAKDRASPGQAESLLIWHGASATVMVLFEGNPGTVRNRHAVIHYQPQRGFLDRLRAWLGW